MQRPDTGRTDTQPAIPTKYFIYTCICVLQPCPAAQQLLRPKERQLWYANISSAGAVRKRKQRQWKRSKSQGPILRVQQCLVRDATWIVSPPSCSKGWSWYWNAYTLTPPPPTAQPVLSPPPSLQYLSPRGNWCNPTPTNLPANGPINHTTRHINLI